MQDTEPTSTLTAGAPGPSGLAALEARLRQDLEWLALPGKSWTPTLQRDGQAVIDVAIIGGGQAGMAASVALSHLGIPNVIYDQSPRDFEGPWATTARMETLRSPKTLTGPALGFPALTFRAWFEAQFGLAAWDALDKIPRLQWMDYLRWFRRVMQLDIRNEHRVLAVQPRADGIVALKLQSPAGESTVLARRVVLATGRDGLGGAYLPPLVEQLPRDRWAHSSDVFDYASLKGKRVGVVGGGSSAMDSAATALEEGAARVDLLIRRRQLPRINKGKGSGNPGLVNGHLHLPDAWKWRIRHYVNVQQVPPPSGSTRRVSRFANARFLLGTAIEKVDVNNDGSLLLQTNRGPLELDFLFFSTGFKIDWSIRPEFKDIAPHILNWSDRYTPPAGEEDRELADSPYLGPVFEFQQKTPGSLPGLERIHCFCYPAAASQGTVSGDIPAISDGAYRLAQGIAALMYSEDVEYHYRNIQSYEEPELEGDEWTESPWELPA
ncbi:NAD(P)/FAD-dependent oxidoreductase [Herbaspirillum sp. AP02]|uniref:NAD(P)-binding domain-containing protein n=1 Tax=unclassified Herbaspirillum TaxID=2624150 RepID=UPI0015DAB2D1|nr:MULTISPECIES: NAD(P)/FAD-dependent oxidoreductase [unclassified Herbaspirillum]MBG7618882.1 NAD(P)/FAD-dependent oxidoreductase [Herbaspirillum sp. AP02]NZD67316.1 NAD(P)/FAD-dependent oxidoreductase [Herbaspirillum sp. AP21]